MPLPGPDTLADMLQRARKRLRYWERELEHSGASGGEIDRDLLATAAMGWTFFLVTMVMISSRGAKEAKIDYMAAPAMTV
jgi:hypothetical protein